MNPCRCDAARFPHRPGSVKNCAPPDCFESALAEGRLIDMPGRENFATDAEYLYESTRAL
jgi:hypothetical protein